MKIELPYLVEDIDRHGNVRLYVRKRGRRKIRIKSLPNSSEFVAEYQAAIAEIENILSSASSAEPTKNSLEWLGHLYMQSADFRRLTPQSQRTRRHILDAAFAEPTKAGLSTKIGTLPLDRLSPKVVRFLRDRKADKPGAANNRLDALRVLFSWAIEHDHLTVNPARDVKAISYASTGFHSWTVEEVAQYEKRHPIGSKARLALALLLFTGLRRSDMVKLGRQHVKDGWIRLTVQKTRHIKTSSLEIPLLPELQSVIGASPCGDLTYLVTMHGKPFSAAGFGNWFREQCDAAELNHCSAHGLRKAGASIAAERGATSAQLMAIYGWESEKLAAHYTRAADRRRLAGNAMHLIVPERK